MEIILYDVVLPKLFGVQIFVFTPSKKLRLSDHNIHVHTTLHSDEVVSILISGCEIVVYSCSPMVVNILCVFTPSKKLRLSDHRPWVASMTATDSSLNGSLPAHGPILL